MGLEAPGASAWGWPGSPLLPHEAEKRGAEQTAWTWPCPPQHSQTCSLPTKPPAELWPCKGQALIPPRAPSWPPTRDPMLHKHRVTTRPAGDLRNAVLTQTKTSARTGAALLWDKCSQMTCCRSVVTAIPSSGRARGEKTRGHLGSALTCRASWGRRHPLCASAASMVSGETRGLAAASKPDKNASVGNNPSVSQWMNGSRKPGACMRASVRTHTYTHSGIVFGLKEEGNPSRINLETECEVKKQKEWYHLYVEPEKRRKS